MVVLGNSELYKLWRRGDFILHPIDKKAFQPNSIDVRLGESIKISRPVKNKIYRFSEPPPHYDEYCISESVCNQNLPFELDHPHKGFCLEPGRFVLGVTLEKFTVPVGFTCTFENRSSVGRMGLVAVNAGRVDTEWTGRLTLELLNTESFPILLEYGMPIGQLVFSEVYGCTVGYGHESLGSKYQHDITAQPRKLGREVQNNA